MDADVDTREGDRNRQGGEERQQPWHGCPDHDQPGEGRRGVAGRHAVARGAHQRLDGGKHLEGPWTLDERLDPECDEVGRPDSDRGRDDETWGASADHDDEEREPDPDEAGEAGDAQDDEDRVERRDPPVGDPGDGVGVYGLWTVTVTVSTGASVETRRVFTIVCSPPGRGLSSMVIPMTSPSRKTRATAASRMSRRRRSDRRSVRAELRRARGEASREVPDGSSIGVPSLTASGPVVLGPARIAVAGRVQHEHGVGRADRRAGWPCVGDQVSHPVIRAVVDLGELGDREA